MSHRYILDLACRGYQWGNFADLVVGRDISARGDIVTVALDWAPDANMKPGQTVYLR